MSFEVRINDVEMGDYDLSRPSEGVRLARDQLLMVKNRTPNKKLWEAQMANYEMILNSDDPDEEAAKHFREGRNDQLRRKYGALK